MSWLPLDHIPIQQQVRGNCDNTLTAGATRRARIIRLMKILIIETWNSNRECETITRALAPSIKPPLTLPCEEPLRIPVQATIIPISRAAPAREVFPRRHPRFRNSLQFGCRQFSSLLRSNALEIPLLPHGNTLDRAESRLSVWLPRIMDATVTHVNEAYHLHLSSVDVASPTLCVFWSVPRVTPYPRSHSAPRSPDRSASTVSRKRLRCLPCSISSAGSRATSLPSFLPSFIGVNNGGRQSRYGFDWQGSLFRTIGSAVTPIRDARVEETGGERVQTLTGFDERTARTLRDHKRPMILECRPTNSGSVRGCPPTDW